MIQVTVLPVTQPIGTFYIGVMSAADLCAISQADVRRLIARDREVEEYLGIQRRLDKVRVAQLTEYVRTKDATFPTSVILAVDERCAELNYGTLTLHPIGIETGEEIPQERIAKVLDGQHRIAGLIGVEEKFEINVAIFVGLDIADQAMIFATVNLAQTKVNRSLAIDLYDYERIRSPIKTCHNVAVALDSEDGSPFQKKIKRLGVRTEGRAEPEFVSQATFVSGLLQHVTDDPLHDRDMSLRQRSLSKPETRTARRLVFRELYVENKDAVIADVVWNFFDAVRDRWPQAWGNMDPGWILTRTTGIRAFMRFLRIAYIACGGLEKKRVARKDFKAILDRIQIDAESFTSAKYLPGTSGQTRLYKDLLASSGLPESGRQD